MKKELLASVLTLTAGMASTVAFPRTALAKSAVIEREFSKAFRLKSADKVRHTTADGQVVLGHLYLFIEQTPDTPECNNKLHGEMTGYFYFESDDYTSDGARRFKTVVSLTGDDGEVLLDITHKSKDNGNTYQVYGCNSTRTMCSADSYVLSISQGKKVEMHLKFAASLKLEILQPSYNGGAEWVTDTYSASMVEVPVE